jgi:hypothetical protein
MCDMQIKFQQQGRRSLRPRNILSNNNVITLEITINSFLEIWQPWHIFSQKSFVRVAFDLFCCQVLKIHQKKQTLEQSPFDVIKQCWTCDIKQMEIKF